MPERDLASLGVVRNPYRAESVRMLPMIEVLG
jgi:hypothetical protein